MLRKAWIPLIVVVLLLLSACAQPAETPPPTQAPQPTDTPQPPPPTEEPAPTGPTGEVILKVTGDIADVDECQFDAAMIEEYAVDQTLDDPWMGDGLEYRGILLSKVWELCGGSDEATAATLVAKDGMAIDVAREDLEQWPIMLAYQVGGENLIDETGGPVKLVFPAEARETYPDEQWMWWIVEVQVQ
jgi:hypothetical protein